MTFAQEREFVKEYEKNKNLAWQLLAEIGGCNVTPLCSIPFDYFETFKQLIFLQSWLKDNRNEYLKLQCVPGRDMGRFSIHLIHLDQVIDEMVKNVVSFKNPHSNTPQDKEKPMDDIINLENAPEEDVDTSKNLLLYKSMWGNEFNKAVLSIRKKIGEKNNKFYQERRQIEFDLLSYTSPIFSSNFRTQVEVELLAQWCKNVLIVLQLAEFLPHSFEHCLTCVTYKNDYIFNSGVSHAAEAQYAFTMLIDLDRIQ